MSRDDKRAQLVAHAAACREALNRGATRHELPGALSDLRGADLSGADLRRPSAISYRFGIDNVRAFAEFLEHSGGFEIY